MTLSGCFSNVRRAKRAIAGAVACGTLLALPGCFIPKFRQATTGLVLPGGYNGAPNGANGATISGETPAENSALLRVDEFYNDPVLTRLVCQAVATNRELKVLEEDIQIARAAVMSSRGAFLPLVGFRAGVGWDRNSVFTPLGAAEKELEYRPGRHFPNTPGDSLLGFNYLIPLDIWRALRNARDAARQRYFAAIERRNYFLTTLVADVAQNYYGLMALDARLQNLDRIITLQQQSLEIARALLKAGRSTELGVQRFQAEVNKNQSEKLIVRQEIVEVENRINRLRGLLPQPVERDPSGFFDLTIHTLNLGVPAQLLQNRPDIRQAERELIAAGLDLKVARAQFFPKVDINGGVGYRAFNPRYLFDPEALVFNAVGELTAPVLNKAAIRADYLSASARQLQALYEYQRVIIDATIEVINRVSMVQNYTSSIALKRQQLQALEASVAIVNKLYLRTRLGEATNVTYVDVLFAQRDLLDARMVLIDTKRQQLSAIVNVYQALGGGSAVLCPPPDLPVGVGGPPRMPEAPQMQPQPEPDQLPPPRPVPEGPKPPELKPAAAVVPMPPRGADRMRPEEDVPPAEVK
jgi:NodT family efflux transporter outer membrane factor (OMF) lipoprotein